jgi:predicted DCC family thiol-disulfide oxidoreductase YuxK
VAERLLRGPAEAESVVLVEDGKAYRKSSAVLRIARRLDGAWPLLAMLLIVPRPLRDALYDWIGRHRYRWFGKREACWRPAPELAERFIDG